MISIEIDEDFYRNAQEGDDWYGYPEQIPFNKFEVKIPFGALMTKKEMIKQIKTELKTKLEDEIDPIMLLREVDKNFNTKISIEFSTSKKLYYINVYDQNNELWYQFSYFKDDDPSKFIPKIEYSQDEIENSFKTIMVGISLRNVVLEIFHYMNKPREIKYKEQKVVKEKPKINPKIKSKNRNKVLTIKKTIYKIKGKKNSKSSSYKRHTDSWHVRGHYRHYRNDEGEIIKKVWIPGYLKGSKKGQINKKYKIKGGN